jgi:hypothetical protein
LLKREWHTIARGLGSVRYRGAPQVHQRERHSISCDQQFCATPYALCPVLCQIHPGGCTFKEGRNRKPTTCSRDFASATQLMGRSAHAWGWRRSRRRVSGRQLSPEYGYGSAGALQVHTNAGSNTFRYSATNLIQQKMISPETAISRHERQSSSRECYFATQNCIFYSARYKAWFAGV